VDDHLGRLLARLDALGAADRTLVIVVADHGDEFFEHGSLGHRQTVFDEVLRIPMLLRLPGTLPAGTVVRGPVSLADIFPTVLELLGLPAADVGGTSLVPLVRGGDTAARAALARLIRFRQGTLTVDGAHKVPGREAIVEEAYVTGSIKVVRRRRWPFGPPGLPASVSRAIHDLGEQAYRREELAWIDVARFPDEPPSAFSTRFDTPAAVEALRRFQDEYRRQTARAGVHFTASKPIGDVVQQKLAGLGYLAAGEEPDTAVPVRAFVLPPPGDTTTPLGEP
jgi:hypothetical protein